MPSAVEKKVNMSLDDIIKACRPGTEKRSGAPRNNTAQNERIPLPRNGLAPKFIGSASAGRQQGGKQAGRRGQQGAGGRAQGALAARQAPMKKYQSRASSGGGRAAGPVTAVRVTIQNTKQAGRTPPPGFVGVPKYNPKAASPAATTKAQRAKAPRPATLNERFTIIAAPAVSRGASAPSYQPQRRSSGATRKRRGGGGGGGAAPMEM